MKINYQLYIKIKTKSFWDLLFYFIAFFFVILIRLLRPLYLIRFSPIRSSRIGHFAGNTELAYLELKLRKNVGKKREFIFFYLKDNYVSNTFLLKMWKRVIPIIPRLVGKSIVSVNRLFLGYNQFEFHPTCEDRDVLNLLDDTPLSLSFTKDEMDLGFSQLEQMGITRGSRYVCLIVRDSAYLNSQEYSYHNYRNCDIDSYRLMANKLADSGIYVIRMGAAVEKEFKTSNKKIVDYATNGFRTEFLDIFLCANCYFTVSTSTGLDAISVIFRKPIVFTSIVPLAYLFTFSNKFIFIPRHHYSLVLSRTLRFREIFDNGCSTLLRSECFSGKQILLKENSPEEILDVVEEMLELVSKGNWQDYSISDVEFNSIYYELIMQYNTSYLHGRIKSRISKRFLNLNPHFLS